MTTFEEFPLGTFVEFEEFHRLDKKNLKCRGRGIVVAINDFEDYKYDEDTDEEVTFRNKIYGVYLQHFEYYDTNGKPPKKAFEWQKPQRIQFADDGGYSSTTYLPEYFQEEENDWDGTTTKMIETSGRWVKKEFLKISVKSYSPEQNGDTDEDI